MDIYLASKNYHKLDEFKGFFIGTNINILLPNNYEELPNVEETGSTFRENAYLKAISLCNDYSYVISDDSGLEVDALNGEPGIYSARYSGDNATDANNINKLLDNLKNVPKHKRTARFKAVICLIRNKDEVFYFEGTCEGMILEKAKGVKGFGYDPIFAPIGYNESFGELGESMKSKLSHRAKAVEHLRNFLNSEIYS